MPSSDTTPQAPIDIAKVRIGLRYTQNLALHVLRQAATADALADAGVDDDGDHADAWLGAEGLAIVVLEHWHAIAEACGLTGAEVMRKAGRS